MRKRPSRAAPEDGACPFGPGFFATAFKDRVGSLCKMRASEISVVLLHLADGRTEDVCHFVLLTPRWLAAAVFSGESGCERMDTVFLPYSLISSVTISKRDVKERRLGFQARRSLPALQAPTPELHAR